MSQSGKDKDRKGKGRGDRPEPAPDPFGADLSGDDFGDDTLDIDEDISSSLDVDLESLPRGPVTVEQTPTEQTPTEQTPTEQTTADAGLRTREIEAIRREATQLGAEGTITPPSESYDEQLDRETMVDGGSTSAPTGDFRKTYLDDDLETMAGDTGGQSAAQSGGTVGDLRGRDTVKGTFAETRLPSPAAREEDEETVYDPSGSQQHSGASHHVDTAKDIGGRTGRGGTRAGERTAAGATARDPIAGTAGSQTRGVVVPMGPVTLREGDLLAERYELVKRLGKGGMGEVWKARHILLKGMRAIKLIKASISRDPAFRERFLAEGQTMMRVKHRGVVEVTDLDETRGNRELFMVMECLDGRTLYDAIRDAEHPIGDDLRAVVRIYMEIAEGMQRIHDERIVHKDVKSDNVLLVKGEDGLEHPKVIDFGLAKQMEDEDAPVEEGVEQDPEQLGYEPDLRTTLSGTLAYMAPEQFRGEPSSFQSDIYAFGVMLHECFMNGEYPLPRGGLAHYLKLHTEGVQPETLSARRPDVNRIITDVVDRCMALDRHDRPTSFTQVAAELDFWLKTPERIRQRNKLVAIVGAFVGVAAIAVLAIIFGGESKAAISEVALYSGTTPLSTYADVDGTIHLSASTAKSVRLTASAVGDNVDPVIAIDGAVQSLNATVEGERISASIDLSGLSDGAHTLAFYAQAGGALVSQNVFVDRTDPVIEDAQVPDSVGEFTNSSSPSILVRVSGENPDLLRVQGQVGTKLQPASRLSADGSRSDWSISGFTEAGKNREYTVVVSVEDRAGNATRREVRFTQDTVTPEASVEGVRPGPRGGNDLLLALRDGAGQTLTATVSEAGTAELRVGSNSDSKTVAERGVVTFDLPSISRSGEPTTFTFTDRAGNSTEKRFTTQVVTDELFLTADSGNSSKVIKGDAPVTFQMERTYPLTETPDVVARLVRQADGRPAQGAQQIEVRGRAQSVTDYIRTFEVAGDQFADGTWELTIPSLQGAKFTLTRDSRAPVIGTIVVRQPDGTVVAPGSWARSQQLLVTVPVTDLSPRRLTLDGAAPKEPLEPGAREYTFSVSAKDPGLSSFPLSVADGANNSDERSVDVRADWVPPSINSVTSPRSGVAYKERVPFDVVISEPNCKLEVAAPGIPTFTSNPSEQGRLTQTEDFPIGTHDLQIVAIDQAGGRSAPTTVRVLVEPASGLASQVEWKQGVSATMNLVKEGAVLMKSRLFPVSNVYVDRYEVCNGEYRRFLEAVSARGDDTFRHADQPAGWDHTPPAETWADARFNAADQPVVNVAYWDAYAFARWSGRRLPTEAEWLKAAAYKDGEDDQRSFPPVPAGTDMKGALLAVSDAANRLAAPVPITAGDDISPVGCMHMGGNASEWVELNDARAGESPAGLAGGNWFFSVRAANLKDVRAKGYDRSVRDKTMGFRCAVGADQIAGSSK